MVGLALISDGRGNRSGHPVTEFVERLEARRVGLLVTARDGGWRIEVPAGGRLRRRRLDGGG